MPKRPKSGKQTAINKTLECQVWQLTGALQRHSMERSGPELLGKGMPFQAAYRAFAKECEFPIFKFPLSKIDF